MSNFFRRSNSHMVDKAASASATPPDGSSTLLNNGANSALSHTSLDELRKPLQPQQPAARKSMTNATPPSPGTPPLEMAGANGSGRSNSYSNNKPGSRRLALMPSPDDFINNNKKKNRASTGLSLHRAIHFVGGSARHINNKKEARPQRRRASSFDYSNSKTQQLLQQQQDQQGPSVGVREPWALPAEEGTGLKARRMSLSLPDDFTVDVADLHDEFDYQHKMGRHRKHLGKGATSKVALMFRRGFPDELYAVKEFRGKSSSETRDEYEKKVKSEYSIAKSLHHPNIVETVRLCADHGRWNHVMEYCQEGDLFSLVEKKYLPPATTRDKDRQCLFKQLVQGLNYLHSHGIAHRDIKLENLLITSNSKLKITDFGVSEVFSGIHPGLREAGGQCGKDVTDDVRLCAPGICGSLPYISPEVLAAKAPYDPRKLDVWGAAIVMLHLIFGAPLWKEARLPPPADGSAAAAAATTGTTGTTGNTAATGPTAAGSNSSAGGSYAALVRGWARWDAVHEPGDNIADGDYPKVPAFDFAVNPPVLRRILLQMLNPDPLRRITIDKVASMRWMRSVECCQLESYDDPARFIDAAKPTCATGQKKIYCHDHLPPRGHGSHSIGKMPKAGSGL